MDAFHLLLISQIHDLQSQNELLKAQNDSLAAKHELFLVSIQELADENKALKHKLIQLEDKLGINSSNSGLPTSKDVYRLEKKKRQKSNRRAGGQPGHPHHGYERRSADVILDVYPQETFCSCGGSLVLTEAYQTHQKIEIPPIKPVVTDYYLRQKICTVCQRRYQGRLGDYQLLGKHAEVIISGLSGFFNNSKREVQAILSQLFHLDISLGLVSMSEKRVSDKLENKYLELTRMAEESSYLHLDETGANNQGKRGWCWVAANKMVTVFKLANSRGRKVLETFLPDYTGKVISDRYPVYQMFERKNRQICLAHLRRDFKRFAHSHYPKLAQLGGYLLHRIDCVFALYQAHQAGKINGLYYLRHMRKVKKKLKFDLKKLSTVHEHEQAQRVAKLILNSFDMMWLFVENGEIEPTNNFAERQIKHFVKYRKNSFFTWSSRGDRFLERIKSVYASAKLQNLNPWEELTFQLS